MMKIGIHFKLLFIVLVLSLVPMVVLGLYSFKKIEELDTISKESIDKVLRSMGEEFVERKASNVAKELEVYLKAHPRYTLDDLRKNTEFRELAVQPVGQTGYTAVHELGTGINRFHINPKVEDLDLHELATKLPEFWKILEPHLKGVVTKGYYKWQDPDGKIRDKFMVCVPVKENKYGVAATTYIDEFLLPRDRVYKHIDYVKNRAIKIFFITLIFTVPFAVGLSFLFSRRITRPLLHLTKVADRISMGELGAKIEVKTKDEIRVLADALRRMQISLKAAIERLRRKRSL
jgi:methyl-accepting chemotaxis protein